MRIEERHVSLLAAALGPDFVVDEEGLREAIRLRRSHNVFFLPTVLKIDLFVRGGTPFDDSELSRRLRTSVGDAGSALFVATPEDNILRKLVWFRMGDEVSDRQWRDILGILRISGYVLDLAYLRGRRGSASTTCWPAPKRRPERRRDLPPSPRQHGKRQAPMPPPPP